MSIKRFSSRRQKLDASFLNERLKGAKSYDRVAGYFSSSILEVAGEALEAIEGRIRMVCNSDLNVVDVSVARNASAVSSSNTNANFAIRREWCSHQPEEWSHKAKGRFQRLYEFLKTGKLEVRVLPSEAFGLVHGKAGVVTKTDGSKTSFMGSANETKSAWKLNYELVWEDDSEDSVNWVQEEFDALWGSHHAVPLAEFVIEDIGRCAKRTVISDVDEWKKDPDPASLIIESPVYRKEFGLWAHQKYFIKRAFDAHKTPQGARFVLADMVGLGKTLEMAVSAMLMGIYGKKPILIIAPPPLLQQWQDELWNLLGMPSAVWTGKSWIVESGAEHPVAGPEGIKKCPRKVGIVSQGVISQKTDAAKYLKELSYECVITDEAHRSRRKNLGRNREGEKPDPNNLMSFLMELSPRTKSMILATATPVQMYPVEAWDMLNVLAMGNDSVLGDTNSLWRQADKALALVLGEEEPPADELRFWDLIRNPIIPYEEDPRNLGSIRKSLNLSDATNVIPGDKFIELTPPENAKLRRARDNFVQEHNPFLRHIIRRTRNYLENTINPETNEPYLQPVRVKLLGERESDAIPLSTYLRDAYELAEQFCKLVSTRVRGGGFLKTLLLRRVGSTIKAGRNTAEKMLNDWDFAEDVDDDDLGEAAAASREMRNLTGEERDLLQRFADSLEAFPQGDPKYQAVEKLLSHGYSDEETSTRPWLEEGCIIFSQYYDSVYWLATELGKKYSDEPIGIYAGGGKSGIYRQGSLTRCERDSIKTMVRTGEIRLVLGTDAASEGLNLQRLGTLINLDLPWNPTRLEQRKGRIQRIGQARDIIHVYNLRYKDSVEDRVHELLSERLKDIFDLFGQIPDVLEDVWVDLAFGEIENAKKRIDAVPEQHPFELKYHKIEHVDWESCEKVLAAVETRTALQKGW